MGSFSKFAYSVWGQAFSLTLGIFAIYCIYRVFRRISRVIHTEYRRGAEDAELITQQISLPEVADSLSEGQILYFKNFILPKYLEHREKYLYSSILDISVSLFSSLLSLAIAIISGTQIINNLRAALEIAAGPDAIILRLILEPQEIVAVLAALQVVVQGISKLLQLSERTLNHRFTASRLYSEAWEFLGRSQEYSGGYSASFGILAATTAQAVTLAETQLLQQQGPQMKGKVKLEAQEQAQQKAQQKAQEKKQQAKAEDVPPDPEQLG